MTPQTVSCPHCRSLLRSDRPVRPGATLRCPDCKSSFTAPEPPPDLPTRQRPVLLGVPFLIAVIVSVVLGSSIIAGAIIVGASRKSDPITRAAPVEDRSKELEQLKGEIAALKDLREQQDRAAHKREYSLQMKLAGHALARRLYAEAIEAYESALKLEGHDPEASQGLLAARRAQSEEAKKSSDLPKLLAESKKALAAEQYALAVEQLQAARKIDPTNQAISDDLLKAQKLLFEDTAKKKVQADMKQHLEAGKAAMMRKDFLEAFKEYTLALGLMPEDLEAQQGQKEAKRKLQG
jgi:tetratricopeptide (TPR) repeat protein